MSIELQLKTKLRTALAKMGYDVDETTIVIERSKEKIHGDFATNVAMQMARSIKQNPMIIAENIQASIDMDGLDKIEVVRPGFINFFMKSDALSAVLKSIIEQGEHYGDSLVGQGKRINVEFVSANPTGDLHLGHARGAALGDSICRLYSKIGYDVTREYYVNDAGNQINVLGSSLRARYHQVFGENVDVPENGYHAADLIKLAELMKDEVGDKYLVDSDEAMRYFMRRGAKLELDKLNEDLRMFRVDFDVFSYETDIRANHGVEDVLSGAKSYIYASDGAQWLKTSEFGDDKDRVIIKKDGSYTYLLPDIAYHLNKLSRGYTQLIDILGADHHGYINRMKGALQMFGYPREILEIELIQMVRLFKDGAEYKMSKRTGNAVSMRELCNEVGIDAVRYFFVARAASAHLDFDLDLAKEQSSSNPVYYAQYAHARLVTVRKAASDITIDIEGKELREPSEMALLKWLGDYQKTIEDAAITRSPYKIIVFIQKLASLVHGFYTECRILNRDDVAVTSSRLALAQAAEIVLRNALALIGVSAPEKM